MERQRNGMEWCILKWRRIKLTASDSLQESNRKLRMANTQSSTKCKKLEIPNLTQTYSIVTTTCKHAFNHNTTRLLRVTQRAHGTWVLKVSERKVVNVETDERSWAPCFEICVSEGGRCECGTGKGISAIPIFQPLPSPFSNLHRLGHPHFPTPAVPIFQPPPPRPSPFSNLHHPHFPTLI